METEQGFSPNTREQRPSTENVKAPHKPDEQSRESRDESGRLQMLYMCDSVHISMSGDVVLTSLR